ncbi:hypothetical protein ENSA7_18360 [Enhygromyxa salina]|uniref:Uncharacterized protein n=2 Tax=Enhygromyxa salina TaxID=215803 RepID=A0A2S9YTZ7_9BACT|nr:hypothetical protein ENSA7_18360 [Enhygromyxa salina]
MALLGALGCRRAPPQPEPQTETGRATVVEAPTSDEALSGYLDGAVIDASYDTITLARLLRSLPRPSPTPSPLVSVFGGLVDHFSARGDARLDAIGLQQDARIRLSIRPLDGRAAAVRKLLGELESDGAPAPELVTQLSSQGRTLGVHLRASLPTSDRARLLRVLERLTIGDDDVGDWAQACETLDRVALCSGRPRLLVWARSEGEDRLRVDGIYLFYAGAEPADLARAIERADTWPTAAAAPEYPNDPVEHDRAPIQVLVHAGPTLALLEAEALADAVVRAGADTLDYHEYLDLERALKDSYPQARVFEGVGMNMDYADDRLSIDVRWIAAERPPAPLPELFAPIIERGALPVTHGDCEAAQACVRIGGLSMVTRFAPLADGPFADTVGAARVLRHAGDRGLVMLGLCSWPNLLGTAGVMAQSSEGMIGRAQSALLNDSYGLGLMLLELGDDPSASVGERWVGYLRAGPGVLTAIRPVLTLAGSSPEAVELPGVEASVERGLYEEVAVYLVDEAARRGGHGAWMIAADADERVGWLLETPRDDPSEHEIEPLWLLRVAALGPLAAREDVPYADDPPVRKWLDRRSLELRGRFTPSGPQLELQLESR